MVVFFKLQNTMYVILCHYEMTSDVWRSDEGAGAVMRWVAPTYRQCVTSLLLTAQFAVDLPRHAVTAVLKGPLWEVQWEEEHDENWLCDPFNSIPGSFNNMEIQMLDNFVMYDSKYPQTLPFSFPPDQCITHNSLDLFM